MQAQQNGERDDVHNAGRGTIKRITMFGQKVLVDDGVEDMARADLQRARNKRKQWEPDDWKDVMYDVCRKHRKTIRHGGRQPRLGGPAPASEVRVVPRADVGVGDSESSLCDKIRICPPIRFLASGTFGSVYRCAAEPGSAVGDETIGFVAVKVVDKIDRSAEVHQAILPTQLRREIDHLTMLRGYDGVIQLLSWTEGMFDVQLVLQLYEEDLRTHIRRGGFHGRPGSLARTCKQLLTGLSHIHGLKILHRDIKPANVMMSATGDIGEYRAVISDLGSSIKMSAPVASGVPPVGICDTEVTTCTYRAPELFFKGCQCNYPADIWAMGVSIVEMENGSVPFGKNVQKESHMSQIFFDQLSILFQTQRSDGWLLQNPRAGLQRLSGLKTVTAGALPWGGSQGAQKSQFQEFVRMFFQAVPASRPLAKELTEHTFLQDSKSCSAVDE